MFERKDSLLEIRHNIATLQELLLAAKEKLELQEKSIQKSKDNVKMGGTGGFIPPHTSQELLTSYQNEVRDLELRIKELELQSLKKQLQAAKESVQAQETSIHLTETIAREGGCGGIVPPYMSKQILNHEREKVRKLEAQISHLESQQPNEEKLEAGKIKKSR